MPDRARCRRQPLDGLPLPGSTPERTSARTQIVLRVKGCDACRVRTVQSDQIGNITFSSKPTPVRHGSVTLHVPTSKTVKMSFVVTAPFDDYQLPLVAVIAYRSTSAGEKIKASYTRGRHPASACWAGTNEPEITNTLFVTKHQGALAYGEGHGTVAGAHLRTALASLPNYVNIRDASYHVSEATMCFDPAQN